MMGALHHLWTHLLRRSEPSMPLSVMAGLEMAPEEVVRKGVFLSSASPCSLLLDCYGKSSYSLPRTFYQTISALEPIMDWSHESKLTFLPLNCRDQVFYPSNKKLSRQSCNIFIYSAINDKAYFTTYSILSAFTKINSFNCNTNIKLGTIKNFFLQRKSLRDVEVKWFALAHMLIQS